MILENICKACIKFYETNPCGDYEMDVRHFIYEQLEKAGITSLGLDEIRYIEYQITGDEKWND